MLLGVAFGWKNLLSLGEEERKGGERQGGGYIDTDGRELSVMWPKYHLGSY